MINLLLLFFLHKFISKSNHIIKHQINNNINSNNLPKLYYKQNNINVSTNFFYKNTEGTEYSNILGNKNLYNIDYNLINIFKNYIKNKIMMLRYNKIINNYKYYTLLSLIGIAFISVYLNHNYVSCCQFM
jgi:hypothetical protein